MGKREVRTYYAVTWNGKYEYGFRLKRKAKAWAKENVKGPYEIQAHEALFPSGMAGPLADAIMAQIPLVLLKEGIMSKLPVELIPAFQKCWNWEPRHHPVDCDGDMRAVVDGTKLIAFHFTERVAKKGARKYDLSRDADCLFKPENADVVTLLKFKGLGPLEYRCLQGIVGGYPLDDVAYWVLEFAINEWMQDHL